MTSSSAKLTVWQKLAYGIGDFGNSVGPGTIIPFWYSFFLTDIVRLDLRLVGLFWLIVTAWDAVNDPLFGFLSDRTRTRWGRRRPYLLFGALPFGLSFMVLWLIPDTSNQTLLFLYYTVAYILYEAAFTAVSCPYIALMPELTDDHDERTSLVTYRMAVSIGAGLLAPLLLGFVVFPMFEPRDPTAYQTIGLVSGIAFIFPLLIAFFGTKERVEFQAQEPLPLREAVAYVAKNKAFRYSTALRLLSWTPVVIVQGVFAYYLTYWTGMNEDEAAITQGVILAMAFVTLPIVTWLSKRYEKKQAYNIGAITWVIVMLALFWVPANMKIPVYIVGGLAGFGVAAAHVLPEAISPDVLEVDELESGRRQEGAYAGIMVFIDKLSRMLVLAVLPVALRWSGYIQPVAGEAIPTQPDSALTVLRVAVSLVPAVLLVLSIIVARAYPITREKYAEIQAELQARRGVAD